MSSITQPGKFEGAPSYAPMLYRWSNEGARDDIFHEGGTMLCVFDITEELVTSLANGDAGVPEEGCDCDDVQALQKRIGDRIVLREDDEGFVEVSVCTVAEVEAWKADSAAADADAYGEDE